MLPTAGSTNILRRTCINIQTHIYNCTHIRVYYCAYNALLQPAECMYACACATFTWRQHFVFSKSTTTFDKLKLLCQKSAAAHSNNNNNHSCCGVCAVVTHTNSKQCQKTITASASNRKWAAYLCILLLLRHLPCICVHFYVYVHVCVLVLTWCMIEHLFVCMWLCMGLCATKPNCAFTFVGYSYAPYVVRKTDLFPPCVWVCEHVYMYMSVCVYKSVGTASMRIINFHFVARRSALQIKVIYFVEIYKPINMNIRM